MNEMREIRERNVLSDLCQSEDAYDIIKKKVTASDFTETRQGIFNILMDLWKSGKAITFDIVEDVGEATGVIKTKTAKQELNAIWNSVSGLPAENKRFKDQVDTHIHLLKESSLGEFFGNDPSAPASDSSIFEGKCGGARGGAESCNALASKAEGSVTKPLPNRNKALQSVTASNEGIGVSDRLKEYIEYTSGWFSNHDVDKECDILPTEKTARRVAMKRLCDSGILQRHPTKEGLYRRKNIELVPIKYLKSIPTPLDIELPFDLHNLVDTYPKNIIHITGEQDAGKTAFMFDFLQRNQNKHKIFYWSSELGNEMFTFRWDKLGIGAPNFEINMRSRDFADVISLYPDDIHCVDYFQINDNFYLVAEELESVFNALNKGVCLFATQKSPGKTYGRGGDFGAEKPVLYCTLEKPQPQHGIPHKLNIIKAKNWKNPQINPNGMSAEFKVVNGCKIIVTSPVGLQIVTKPQSITTTNGKQLSLV